MLTKCDAMLDVFSALDKRERLPLKLTLHLLSCKNCRSVVRLCTLAERAVSRPLFAKGNDQDVAQALERVQAYLAARGSGKKRPFISLSHWILVGVGMILSMICVGFVNLQNDAPPLQMSSYMVFGSLIAVYCAFFVGSNLDFFVKLAAKGVQIPKRF